MARFQDANIASPPPTAGDQKTAGRAATMLGAIALGGLFLLTIWLLPDVLLMIFAAVLIAIALHGSGAWVGSKTGLPIHWAMTLIVIGVLGLMAAVVWWGGTTLAEQIGQMGRQLEQDIGTLRAALSKTDWGRYLVEHVDWQDVPGTKGLAGTFAGAALGTFGVLGSVLLVTVAAVYLAAEPDLYRRGFLRLLPPRSRDRGAEVLREIGNTLTDWLIGRAIDMAVVVGLTFAGLMLLDMPLALMLAIVAGLLNFVPYIGAIAGAVPAVLVAFGQSPVQALWVGLLFLAIQMVEGYLLAPYIQQRTTRLPPVVTLLSQTAFGSLFGTLGLLLAPALATVILVAIRMLYVEDVLGDRPAGCDEPSV